MPREGASIAIVTAPDFEMIVHSARGPRPYSIATFSDKYRAGKKVVPRLREFSLEGYVKLELTTRGSQEVKSFNPLKRNVYNKKLSSVQRPPKRPQKRLVYGCEKFLPALA